MFARWDGEKCLTHRVCVVGSMYGSAAVIVDGAHRYRAYIADDKWNGGEVREYETLDGGGTWLHRRDITHDSPAPNAFPRPVLNPSPELQVVWCSGDLAHAGKVHAWGQTGDLPDNPTAAACPTPARN